MSDPRYGFRLSTLDLCVLLAGAAATWACRHSLGTYAWLFAVAVGHFFLFCNVFRLRRTYELLWTGVFIANFGLALFTHEFSWPRVLAIQAPFTVLAISAEVASPRYHGVFARQLNGRLDDYLAQRPLRPSPNRGTS